MRRILWTVAVVAGALQVSHAKDTGEFDGVPGAREWFQGATQKRCCDIGDGHRGVVRRVGENQYEAMIDGQWLHVPPTAVIKDELSPWGFPVIWYYGKDGCSGSPCIRCLMLSGGV